MTPPFNLQGALKCWTQILNCWLPTPVPPATKIPCCFKFIKAFVSYKNMAAESSAASGACRAPPLARLKGFWRTFRGYGPEEDIDLGFSLWERDHWISARAIELFLSTGYRVLEEDSILASTTKAQLRLALDEAKAAWEEYAVTRTRRCDRLRVRLVYNLWRWCISTEPRFAATTPDILFEPSMPGYSLEYLTWIPGSPDWLSHISALDAAEPWMG
ncbi:hypothetical protein PC120_g6976 [Phytophthora cactorum]|nr:hypothetical protein PC120_g6976 [Phytophthora cactorum]